MLFFVVLKLLLICVKRTAMQVTVIFFGVMKFFVHLKLFYNFSGSGQMNLNIHVHVKPQPKFSVLINVNNNVFLSYHRSYPGEQPGGAVWPSPCGGPHPGGERRRHLPHAPRGHREPHQGLGIRRHPHYRTSSR
jgi:hypothetical protein